MAVSADIARTGCTTCALAGPCVPCGRSSASFDFSRRQEYAPFLALDSAPRSTWPRPTLLIHWNCACRGDQSQCRAEEAVESHRDAASLSLSGGRGTLVPFIAAAESSYRQQVDYICRLDSDVAVLLTWTDGATMPIFNGPQSFHAGPWRYDFPMRTGGSKVASEEEPPVTLRDLLVAWWLCQTVNSNTAVKRASSRSWSCSHIFPTYSFTCLSRK